MSAFFYLLNSQLFDNTCAKYILNKYLFLSSPEPKIVPYRVNLQSFLPPLLFWNPILKHL